MCLGQVGLDWQSMEVYLGRLGLTGSGWCLLEVVAGGWWLGLIGHGCV